MGFNYMMLKRPRHGAGLKQVQHGATWVRYLTPEYTYLLWGVVSFSFKGANAVEQFRLELIREEHVKDFLDRP